MWQMIRDVLMSPNVTIVLCFLVFVLTIGVILSKTGLLQIHTNAVQIGAADRERNIIRQQVEWIKLHCSGMEASMTKPENYNEWRGKYIAECVYDEYVDWITFNHLSLSDAYIEIKQDRIVNLVNKLTTKPEFHSEEFERELREDVRTCIEKLVQIRTIYK